MQFKPFRKLGKRLYALFEFCFFAIRRDYPAFFVSCSQFGGAILSEPYCILGVTVEADICNSVSAAIYRVADKVAFHDPGADMKVLGVG